MKRLILLASISITAISPLSAAPDLDQAAADACQCLEAPYREISKALVTIKQAQNSGDMSKLMASQAQMMAILQSSASCFEGLSKKYPEIDNSDELKKQVAEKTEKMCPNPAMSQ
jgi:hypothetical protein